MKTSCERWAGLNTLSRRRTAASLVLVMLGLIGATLAKAQSVPVYGIFQGQQFMQVADSVMTAIPARPAYWECWVHGFSPTQLRAAQVSTPLGGKFNLSIDTTKENASVAKDYQSAAARLAVFPSGAYALQVTRTDMSIFSVAFTQSAPAYPAPPRFSNLTTMDFTAGRDLKFDWEKSSDATADDFVVLQVSGVNPITWETWEFHTAWPGLTGALSGLATTATVPGGLVKPSDILTVALTQYRISDRQTTPNGLSFAGSATAISTTISVPDQPQGGDTALYRLLTSRSFKQNDPSAPTALQTGGFGFEASAWAVAEDRLTNVTVGLPPGVRLNLLPSGDHVLWQTNLAFDTESQLLTAAPSGNYRWTFAGLGAGTQTVTTATEPFGAWPAPLTVSNWATLQTNSFTKDVVVRWTAPPGALASDQVEFIVTAPGGQVAYRQPDYANGDSPLAGTATQLTIRAKKLTDGLDYEGRLRYIHVLRSDTQSLSGATGLVAQCSETRFPLGSRVAFPLVVLTTNLPAGEVGQRYRVQLLGNWGRRPYSWSLAQGSLPLGLQLNSNGVIAGTPTTNSASMVVVEAVDAIGQRASQALRLDVTGIIKPLELATTSLSHVVPGAYYFTELSIRGGVEPYQWSVASGRLPTGLDLQSCCGIIAGEPLESGDFAVELQLQDGAGQVQKRAFSLSVPPEALAPPLQIKSWSRRADGALALALTGLEGDPITVEASDDLRFWSSVLATNLPADRKFQVPARPGQRGFLRARFGHDRPVPDPVLVKPTLATNRFAEGTLYTNSLSLRLTNDAGIILQLDLPTNAVARPERIRMTLVPGIAGLPLNSLLWAVDLRPDGLSLLKAGTLTVTYPAGAPADAISFAYGRQGRDCHLNPALCRNGQVIIPIQHFSGAGQGQGNQQQARDLANRPPCLPMYAGEQAVAAILQQSYPDFSPTELLQTAMTAWFNQSVLPNLKKAEKDDGSLDAATAEFLRWSTLDQLLLSGGWNETAKASLARGMVNAINKAEARCSSNFDPGEVAVMIGRDRQALLLGLEQYAPEALDSEKVLDRVSRCLCFELKLESIIDVPGKWVEQVRSAQLRFKWNKKDISEGGIYVRAESSASLDLVSWDFYKDNVRPLNGSGSVNGIWLKLVTDSQEDGTPPDESNPCQTPPASNPPTSVQCFFKATDPLQGMEVRDADGKWWPIDIPVDAGGRWGSAFKEAHLEDWTGLPDLDGNEMTGFLFKDWEMSGGEVFATREFTGPIEISEGRAIETTYLELRHTPKANSAP